MNLFGNRVFTEVSKLTLLEVIKAGLHPIRCAYTKDSVDPETDMIQGGGHVRTKAKIRVMHLSASLRSRFSLEALRRNHPADDTLILSFLAPAT